MVLASDLLSRSSSFSFCFLNKENYFDHNENIGPRQMRAAKKNLRTEKILGRARCALQRDGDIALRNVRVEKTCARKKKE